MSVPQSEHPRFPAPADLLPHRPPMLLLRAVRAHAPGRTLCEGWFSAEFARACGGEVSPAFGLELIAQSAAVHHALCQLQAHGNHEPAARGLLVGSRRLALGASSLPADEPLRVTVEGGDDPRGLGGLIRFRGRVESARGEILAGGDVTVLEWRPEGPAT